MKHQPRAKTLGITHPSLPHHPTMALVMAPAVSTIDPDPASDPAPSNDYLRAVAVLDDALDVEGKAVRAAADRLTALLAPSPTNDGEIELREAASTSTLLGRGYKSPYHDAHHATLVSCAAMLRRALGGGPGAGIVGSGFADGAEMLVRDAMHAIDGAAKDALRRDQGELPRLYDIARNLRARRDEARGAARELVLAFGRERQGLGFRERQRMRDAVVQARDEALREAEEDKARLIERFEVQADELAILQRQMTETREAPEQRVAQLTSLLAAERTRRLADGREYEASRAVVKQRYEMAERKIAELTGKMRAAKRDAAEAQRKLEDEVSDLRALLESARGQALNAREVVKRTKDRLLREKIFRAWRAKTEYDVDTGRLRDDAASTLRATKRGYEEQLTKQRLAFGEELDRLRGKMRVMEEEADARDRRMRLSATTFHFHPMRHALRDGPPAFSAESAAAAAAVRSISAREGRLGLSHAVIADERRADGRRTETDDVPHRALPPDARTTLGDMTAADRAAAVGWGRSADRVVPTETLGGEWRGPNAYTAAHGWDDPGPNARDPWAFLAENDDRRENDRRGGGLGARLRDQDVSRARHSELERERRAAKRAEEDAAIAAAEASLAKVDAYYSRAAAAAQADETRRAHDIQSAAEKERERHASGSARSRATLGARRSRHTPETPTRAAVAATKTKTSTESASPLRAGSKSGLGLGSLVRDSAEMPMPILAEARAAPAEVPSGVPSSPARPDAHPAAGSDLARGLASQPEEEPRMASPRVPTADGSRAESQLGLKKWDAPKVTDAAEVEVGGDDPAVAAAPLSPTPTGLATVAGASASPIPSSSTSAVAAHDSAASSGAMSAAAAAVSPRESPAVAVSPRESPHPRPTRTLPAPTPSPALEQRGSPPQTSPASTVGVGEDTAPVPAPASQAASTSAGPAALSSAKGGALSPPPSEAASPAVAGSPKAPRSDAQAEAEKGGVRARDREPAVGQAEEGSTKATDPEPAITASAALTSDGQAETEEASKKASGSEPVMGKAEEGSTEATDPETAEGLAAVVRTSKARISVQSEAYSEDYEDDDFEDAEIDLP